MCYIGIQILETQYMSHQPFPQFLLFSCENDNNGTAPYYSLEISNYTILYIILCIYLHVCSVCRLIISITWYGFTLSAFPCNNLKIVSK